MIVLADADPRFQTRVKDHIGREDELLEVANIAQLEKILLDRAGRVDLVILGPNLALEEALGAAARMQATGHSLSVLLISNAVTTDILQSAMRSGIREVLPAAFTTAQLREAIGRSTQLSQQIRGAAVQVHAQPITTDHRVITVFSSKGGCGKSFVASNLAVALAARSGQEVAMVDLDLQFGDLAIMLQLFPARTIFDAAQSLDASTPTR